MMPRGKSLQDVETLEMALIGYQTEKEKIEDKIREIQTQLKGKRLTTPAAGVTAGVVKKNPAKRILSPGARRRIAAAQKKRWAEHRKRAAQAAQE